MLERIRKSKDEGFTLIELLIVIIILGILAAIVVFAVGSTRGDSVTASCKTDVKSIQLGAEAVKTKTGQYPGTQNDLLTSSNSAGGAVLKSWPGGTSSTSDDIVLTYSGTPAKGPYTDYSLTVAGKNLTGGTLTSTSDDAAVATACTSS